MFFNLKKETTFSLQLLILHLNDSKFYMLNPLDALRVNYLLKTYTFFLLLETVMSNVFSFIILKSFSLTLLWEIVCSPIYV